MVANYRVKLLPQGQMFEVRPNEIILDAAVRQGIDIIFTCRNGTCRTCLSQVIEGEVLQQDVEMCLISVKELSLNKRLICMCTLNSDAVIEPKIRSKTSKLVN